MPEEPDPHQPPPDEPGLLGGVSPDEMFARGMQSVRMTGGPGEWQPPTMEEAAQLFPGYEVLQLLGRGGMGAVFKARQIELDRFVAIKLLPLEISVDQNFVGRFRREARAMAKLNHPNIIAVHDFGQTGEGHLFFVMEFVEGANLHEIIQQVGLDPDQALLFVGQVCAALAYAHGKGVVHRDIKPANVMVNDEGHVKVADFGLARLTDPAADIFSTATTGLVMGTPAYMAPEQKSGAHVDHRADIYSLGVMLYEMLCRQVPRGIFPPPSQCIGCDERLDHIVNRAMQQQPELRYQNTAEMKADVDTARTPPPPPQPAVMRASPPKARPIGLWIGLGGGVVVLVVAGFFALMPNPPPQQPATPIAEVAPVKPDETKPPKPTPSTIKIDQPKVASVEVLPVATPKPELAARTTPAPTPPAPRTATPAPKPPSATGIWLAEQEPQWQAAFATEVTAPFEKGVGDLKKQYATALDVQLAAAARSGQLDDAVALRAECKLLADGGAIPAADEATTLAALKALRASYRKIFAGLEAERVSKATIVHGRYDAILAKSLLPLTQSQRLDEALEVKAKREQLTAAWLKPPSGPIERRLAATIKDQPFVNSLGMKFLPVPITGGQKGGQVLFSVWETRVQDYEVFAMETKREWPNAGIPQGPTHPAVFVNWEDAVAFCAWLSKKEGRSYRLPTDAEWSVAAGLGVEPGNTPGEKNGKVAGYPWGTAWPPPQGAGNYGSNLHVDSFEYTSPVGSFAANAFGIYDLSGNVWEWCEDSLPNQFGVLRGGSWFNSDEIIQRSSCRHFNRPDARKNYYGFRCVMVVSGG